MGHFGGAKAFRFFESCGVCGGGNGGKTLGMLMAMGIRVYLAGEETDVARLAAGCLSGKLVQATPGNSGCHEHGHHDHEGHHEGGCKH